MLPTLVHSLSLEESEVEDRDHVLERNLEAFEEYILSSISSRSAGCQSVATMNAVQYHEFQFLPTRVLGISSVEPSPPQGMSFRFPPGDLISTLIATYFMYLDDFLLILHRPKFLKEGLQYRYFQFGKVVLAVSAWPPCPHQRRAVKVVVKWVEMDISGYQPASLVSFKSV